MCEKIDTHNRLVLKWAALKGAVVEFESVSFFTATRSTGDRLSITVNFLRQTGYQFSDGVPRPEATQLDVPEEKAYLGGSSASLAFPHHCCKATTPINLLIQETFHPKTYLGNLGFLFAGSSDRHASNRLLGRSYPS